MFLTLETNIGIRPQVSIHGDRIKCDMGVLLLEFDIESFKRFFYDIIQQAANQGINLSITE